MTENQYEPGTTEEPVYAENTSAPAAVEAAPAGFWIRLWAYAADLLVTGSLSGAVLGLYQMITGGLELNLLVFSLTALLSGVVTYGYFILLTGFWGKTLGKMIFGLRVVSREQELLSWGDILFRELIGRFLHRTLVITNILYLFVAFHPEKRGIHDIIGSTVVIHEPQRTIRLPRRTEQNVPAAD
ncbi:RDD family protein [Alkalicoccus chagannorensis]|uniref:RDD family protein n=1 Tax=Alkalicoccus chagannorensis TaxID=427072 RepID=UPI000400CB1E|nr:RDD family protein [Alkalicoccus chagannorensis]